MTDEMSAPGAIDPTTLRLTRARRLWRNFTRFRRTRPFWGAVILAAGGYFVGAPLLGGSFAFYTTTGADSIIPLVLAFGMCAAAGVAMFAPSQRLFPALVAAAFSVASLPLANLGGWLLGMLFGIAGSSMIFAWAPYTQKQLDRYAARSAARAERRNRRRAGAPTAAI